MQRAPHLFSINIYFINHFFPKKIYISDASHFWSIPTGTNSSVGESKMKLYPMGRVGIPSYWGWMGGRIGLSVAFQTSSPLAPKTDTLSRGKEFPTKETVAYLGDQGANAPGCKTGGWQHFLVPSHLAALLWRLRKRRGRMNPGGSSGSRESHTWLSQPSEGLLRARDTSYGLSSP